MNIEEQYLNLLQDLLANGVHKPNRTGTDTYALFSRTLRHDMSEGFPLLTTKHVPFKMVAVELEGFIKGKTSKEWFSSRGCTIWDEWCNPQKVPYGKDRGTQEKMAAEDDLGPCIYGASWRNFHDPTATEEQTHNLLSDGVDQLANIVNTLQTNPEDRRMICMAWNPLGLNHTALPSCHLGFLVNVLDGKLNLSWWQRSADTFLGVPFNIASYALLLTQLAKVAKLEPGELVGHFEDVHLYDNHIDQVKEQLLRKPRDLPTVTVPSCDILNTSNMFGFRAKALQLHDYDPHPAIKAPVAV